MSYCYKSPSTTSIDSSFSSSSVGDGQMVKRPYRMMSNINFEDQQKITGSKRAKKSPITPGISSQVGSSWAFRYLKIYMQYVNVRNYQISLFLFILTLNLNIQIVFTFQYWFQQLSSRGYAALPCLYLITNYWSLSFKLHSNRLLCFTMTIKRKYYIYLLFIFQQTRTSDCLARLSLGQCDLCSWLCLTSRTITNSGAPSRRNQSANNCPVNGKIWRWN